MQSYFLGLDVSKGYADLLLLDSSQKTVESNFQLDDTFDGHCRLFEFLCTFFKEHPDATVYAAVESTGGYEDNWFNSLHKFQENLNIKVARLNPKGVNHSSRAALQRVITDSVSARNIAEYMIKHPEKIDYESDDYFGTLKRKWQFVQTLVKQKTRLLNQLEKLLYIANPDVLIYCKNGVPQWVLRLLQRYPTAKQLGRAKIKTVALIPYIREQYARELINASRLSIASAEDDLTADSIVIMAKEIRHLDQLAHKQTKLLAEKCSLPELDLLKTFSAIGDSSAIGLLLEIGAVQRFGSAKKLVSFFGLHPKFKISGDGTSGMRMSKEGRKAPRAILYMVAMTAIAHNPLIREVYEHNLAKGKCKMDAMGVCMHKILRIIYGMLKNNQPFDPEIDRKNRMKMLHKKPNVTNNINRRFQQPDGKAPISRRQTKKRKEQKLSQGDPVTVHEINASALSKH
jgi:transposase